MLAYNFCALIFRTDRRIFAHSVSVSIYPILICVYLFSIRVCVCSCVCQENENKRLLSIIQGFWNFWISSKWWFDFSWLHKLSVRIICSSGFDIFQPVATHFMCTTQCLWVFYRFFNFKWKKQRRKKHTLSRSQRCRLCV